MFFVFTHKVLPRAGGGRNISDEIGRRHGSCIIITLKARTAQLGHRVRMALRLNALRDQTFALGGKQRREIIGNRCFSAAVCPDELFVQLDRSDIQRQKTDQIALRRSEPAERIARTERKQAVGIDKELTALLADAFFRRFKDKALQIEFENELSDLLDGFLETLDKRSRIMFVRRYWYSDRDVYKRQIIRRVRVWTHTGWKDMTAEARMRSFAFVRI